MYTPRWGGKVISNKRIEVVVKPTPFVPQPKQPAAYVLDTGTAKTRCKYTGNNMLGVAVMHKSNSVPVFSNTEAVELAQMRRS